MRIVPHPFPLPTKREREEAGAGAISTSPSHPGSSTSHFPVAITLVAARLSPFTPSIMNA